MSKETRDLDIEYGQRLQRMADIATDVRSHTAPHLRNLIVFSDENKWTAAGLAAVYSTDFVDGRWARKGAHLQGLEEPKGDGHERDPKADKDLLNNVLAGLALRYLRENDLHSAAIVGVNYLVTQWRDRKMEKYRVNAKEGGLDKKDIKAINTNRAKTLAQGIAVTALTGLSSDNRRARRVALATLSVGTGTGIVGMYQYGRRVRRKLANATL